MASEQDAPTAIADSALPSTDTEGCRFVVASYEEAAPLVAAVTADAAGRVMVVPALGDFIELRFVDLGPRPGPADSHSAAVRLITEELLAPGGQAGRNYFAIAVADRWAAEAERLLTACASAPFLTTLPLQLHGIASLDDRDPAGQAAACPASMAIAASGAWGHADLVDELRRHADELLRHFAAEPPGLGHDRLDSLRATYEQCVTRERGEQPTEDQAADLPGKPSPHAPARPRDILAAEPPQTVSAQLGQGEPAPPGPAAPGSVQAEPGLAEPGLAEPVRGESGPAERASAEFALPEPPAAEIVPAQPPPSVPDQPATDLTPKLVRLPRWLADPRRWRGKQAEPAETPGPSAPSIPESPAPRIPGLAYLLITGDELADDHGALRRGRAALLSVDAKMATLPQVAFMVRLLQGDGDTLRGELRQAGELTRRDVKHQVADADFATVLTAMRALLRRDFTQATASGAPLAHPAVVFFAADPPLADAVTAEVFSHLVQEASVIWVMPPDVKELLAPAFTQSPHVHVLPDHDDVAYQIAGLLVPASSTRAPTTQTASIPALSTPEVSHPATDGDA